MLSFLFLLATAEEQNKKKLKVGYAKTLTDSYFTKFVEKRKNKKEIWVIMLHTEGNKFSDEAFPKFIKASNLAEGIFRFGIVYTKRNPLTARKFVAKSVPSFWVFHESGKTEYVGDGEPSDIINFCSEYLHDYTHEFDPTWLENSTKSLAVLFTEKEATPNLWMGLSNSFHGNRKVRIGITHSKDLIKQFQANPPEIRFMNSTLNYTYVGKIEFRQIQRDLNAFIDKQLRIPGEIPDVVLDSTEFSKHCIGGVHKCIIYTKDTDQLGWNRLRDKYASMNYVWFQGKKELPWKFLKTANCWIYNPKTEMLIKVDSMSSVGPTLESIYSGEASWLPVDHYLSNEL
ncbi:hypothetical protein TVAG_234120 [Trichomonas vaginalis G3]|uniref:Thioredoxin domain-containing protein n=1 Tax=Trichomonas vaginalis (strain ATCC PRA-98 / G3) TaxID=412133 RepID=A2FXP0_TRIV3|nr:disulfide-isomerase A6 family [Trichomonas vaginalis G3]EAX90319.1 hypothetical protein TVAG_234120 [Trichomonas vaginalis G3]KAI5548136.1 disulfide-isomerase A6 family [Trichomonas vaginalis G3]|eukprot:XP_001303249.1 hypothetical protein [Trichomonas vaginalis G3]